ncbi:GMP synthase (glutamine-hydrolysing) [Lentzea waywayandensis]|uniref:Glutamine amidotransferase n=1 Tax=Lentzea waywayandensis TaxID=84724 RepID=A0A1I6D3V7_9PSEU|nr:hypothetical protein [Lentzea waywayandensis]SFR00156.1 GMP synthase (glutamine-hydrolysing) [Lentzea waywayandensis]
MSQHESPRTSYRNDGGQFDPEGYVNFIRSRFGELAGETVLACVSGGVDSAVSAALLSLLEVDLAPVIIDSGFMSHGEPDESRRLLKESGFCVEVIDAGSAFRAVLRGVHSGPEKRVAFRRAYFDVLERVLDDRNIKFLAQGSQAHGINGNPNSLDRGAHNSPPPEILRKFEIIEPVLGLSKEEIRALASHLQLPPEIVARRPFPGPGLLLRFAGEFTPERCSLIREATHIVDNYVTENKSLFDECWQIFPYLTSTTPAFYIDHSGEPDLGSTLLIRAVRKTFERDGASYTPFFLDWPDQVRLVELLMGIEGIARVCLDITPKYAAANKIGSHIVEYRPGATVEYI